MASIAAWESGSSAVLDGHSRKEDEHSSSVFGRRTEVMTALADADTLAAAVGVALSTDWLKQTIWLASAHCTACRCFAAAGSLLVDCDVEMAKAAVSTRDPAAEVKMMLGTPGPSHLTESRSSLDRSPVVAAEEEAASDSDADYAAVEDTQVGSDAVVVKAVVVDVADTEDTRVSDGSVADTVLALGSC